MWLIVLFLLCCVAVPFLFSSFYNFGAYSIVKGYAMVRAIHSVWLVSRARGVVVHKYSIMVAIIYLSFWRECAVRVFVCTFWIFMFNLHSVAKRNFELSSCP